jgi:hypothetical protein
MPGGPYVLHIGAAPETRRASHAARVLSHVASPNEAYNICNMGHHCFLIFSGLVVQTSSAGWVLKHAYTGHGRDANTLCRQHAVHTIIFPLPLYTHFVISW